MQGSVGEDGMGADDEDGAVLTGDAMGFDEGCFQVDAMGGVDTGRRCLFQGAFTGRKREDTIARCLGED